MGKIPKEVLYIKCSFCGDIFFSRRGRTNKRFCSEVCRGKYKNNKIKEKKKKGE